MWVPQVPGGHDRGKNNPGCSLDSDQSRADECLLRPMYYISARKRNVLSAPCDFARSSCPLAALIGRTGFSPAPGRGWDDKIQLGSSFARSAVSGLVFPDEKSGCTPEDRARGEP